MSYLRDDVEKSTEFVLYVPLLNGPVKLMLSNVSNPYSGGGGGGGLLAGAMSGMIPISRFCRTELRLIMPWKMSFLSTSAISA